MRKLIIGITGTFGSGKTTVAKMLKKRNILVIDADRLAMRAAKNKRVKKKILQEFGTAGRKKLAKTVFSDAKRLGRLNKIIHPPLKREIKKIMKETRKEIVIIDAPLLVEARFLDVIDCLVLVVCNNRTRTGRLVKKGFSEREIAARTIFQLSEAKKEKYADFVIDNSGARKETERQVEKLWKNILKKRSFLESRRSFASPKITSMR